ncbi:MAG TPA: glycosyltransferase family A protein [Flavihumibacter sp.]|jgi:glycosyltransferase involved in cell wall biosynthesis
MKKLAVIIPCYNVEAYIESCLDSVYAQTRQPDEVICVDNNSGDGTLALLERLQASKYPSLRIIKEPRPGASCARNAGLKVAGSEWIQFLDADDLLLPAKLEHQLALTAERTDIGYITAASIRRNLQGEDTVVALDCKNPWIAPFTNRGGNTCSNLWHRESLLELGGWDTNLASSQESELMMRLVLAGKMPIFDPEPLTVIRERASGQISQSDPGARYTRFLRVRLNYIRELRARYEEQYQANKQVLLTYLVSNLLILQKYRPAEAEAMAAEIPWEDWKAAAGFGMSGWKASLIKTLGWSLFAKLFSFVQSKPAS